MKVTFKFTACEGDAPTPLLNAYVDVPAGATENVDRVLSLIDQAYIIPGMQDDPHGVAVESGTAIRDPFCTVTGKLPFVKWLKTKMLK